VDLNHKMIAFSKIATLERSKKNEIYSNCILLQLSASKGQLIFVKEPQTVESKYGVIKATVDWIDIYYLFCILEMQLPNFLMRYQNGININPQIFEYLKLDVHTEIETQKYVIEVMSKLQQAIDIEEKIIHKYQQAKAFYLDRCMC